MVVEGRFAQHARVAGIEQDGRAAGDGGNNVESPSPLKSAESTSWTLTPMFLRIGPPNVPSPLFGTTATHWANDRPVRMSAKPSPVKSGSSICSGNPIPVMLVPWLKSRPRH